MITPAIQFEPDGYVVTGPKIMGRQSAGYGFLRAAVQGREGQVMWGHTRHRSSVEVFAKLVREIEPGSPVGWVLPHQFPRMRELGLYYTPGPGLNVAGRLRLRAGINAYSICGLTHTIASAGAMDEIAGLLTAPIAPWDALICTSSVARDTIQTVVAAQAEYLAWRLGGQPKQVLPMLPVIPLGIHCSDFCFTPEARATTRATLGLAADEVAVLFAGRLSPAGKAHPYTMWRGLQVAAERTGQKIAFIQSGRFFNQVAADMYRASAAEHCPSVRQIFVDGQDNDLYHQVWGAADLFLSLADSIQETFGLTPVEAMAAGLPALVSDWNGYKDTVRDGLDGFRIPTWSPAPGDGGDFARDFETGTDHYDLHLSRMSTTVSVDFAVLVDRLSALVVDADLRQQLGDNGRKRAREVFDWAVVYAQYRALWAEQTAMRQAHTARPGPASSPSHGDPFTAFATYPTHHIGPQTRVSQGPDPGRQQHDRLADGLFTLWPTDGALLDSILAQVVMGELTVQALADLNKTTPSAVVVVVSRLAKMGLIRLSPPVG